MASRLSLPLQLLSASAELDSLDLMCKMRCDELASTLEALGLPMAQAWLVGRLASRLPLLLEHGVPSICFYCYQMTERGTEVRVRLIMRIHMRVDRYLMSRDEPRTISALPPTCWRGEDRAVDGLVLLRRDLATA